MELIEIIRDRFPEVIIIIGGNHVTAVPENIDNSIIDYIILGEGEIPFLELIEKLDSGSETSSIPDLATENSSTYQRSPFIKSLVELPFPLRTHSNPVSWRFYIV